MQPSLNIPASRLNDLYREADEYDAEHAVEIADTFNWRLSPNEVRAERARRKRLFGASNA